MAEEDSMSKRQAEKEVSNMLRPKYQKALMKKYGEFLETLYYMEHSPLHYRVKKAADKYWSDGKSLKKAITLAVKEHRHQLDMLLDEDEEDSEDSDD